MNEPTVPANLGTWIAQLLGGGAVAAALIKLLTFLGSKMSLTLAADQSNAAMREEMRKDLSEARALRAEVEKQLRQERIKSAERDAAQLRRIGILDMKVQVLRDEVERLRHLLLKAGAPGLEDSHEFDARLALLQAEKDEDQ